MHIFKQAQSRNTAFTTGGTKTNKSQNMLTGVLTSSFLTGNVGWWFDATVSYCLTVADFSLKYGLISQCSFKVMNDNFFNYL